METKRNKILNIVAVILAIALITSIVAIYELSEKVDDLQESLAFRTQEIKNEINSIYSNVDMKLEEQASLLSEMSYEDGNFHTESNTAELIIEVTPKVLTDDTTIYLTFDEKDIPCVREKNSFSGIITVDAFKYYEEKPILNIKSNGETKTQVLDDMYIEYMYTNYLGSLNAHSTLNSTYRSYDSNSTSNTKTISFNGSVYFNYWLKGEENISKNIKNAYITAEINGKEVKRTDVTKNLDITDVEITADISFTDTFKVKSKDTVEIFAIVEDNYGYFHKCLVDKRIIDGDDGIMVYAEEVIYDRNGNVLNK